MSNPLISIIIPTYNRANLIRETLDSVLSQTYQNWECLVVDDGSTDGTDQLMAEYCTKDTRFQYYHRPADHLAGGNAARNYGFEVSRGDYINWFDDDDVMLPDFISQKLNAFIEGVDLVICSGSYVDEFLQKPKLIDLKIDTFLYKDYVLWKFKIVTNNVMFRRSFIEKKDLFSLKILRGQETELFSRLFFNMAEKHYKIINKSLFLYRQHNNTKTKENTKYLSKYKRSQILNCIANFEKSIVLNDSDLVQYCYNGSLYYFFEALKYNDIDNAKLVYKKILPILKKIRYNVYQEIKIFGHFFIQIKRGSYKIEQRWKQYEL
ncbi:glycosyltransferase family 2 protein [Formosa haliotis]|uniref:glycosyltransferase family 2 protein n=1 Tax=Formosa haliotis TaxID=1555194 RepID=UPI0008251186|nr:glycosyltransferase family 2 protein [Formosa haliotis]